MNAKKYIYPLLFLMTALFCLPSCLTSDDDTEEDEHCYISAFTLGSIKRIVHTTGKAGQDSTYSVSYSGALYPMSINQITQTIENRDSLPYGSQVRAVLTTVTFKGVLYYREAADSIYTTYSNKDSIDFTGPVDFVNYPTLGHGVRHYNVKVNVHQVKGDSLTWARFDSGERADELETLTACKMVALGDRLVMMGRTAKGEVVSAIHSRSNVLYWDVDRTDGVDLSDADLSTLCTFNNMALMSNAKGEILQSHDGRTWAVMHEAAAGRRLIGAGNQTLYAVTNGQIESLGKGESEWQKNAMDADASNLPDDQLSLSYFNTESGYERLVLVGNNSQKSDTKAEAWIKSWRGEGAEANAEWMYCTHTNDNKSQCPEMSPLFTMAYDDQVIALGGKSANGNYKSLEKILYSPDFGITWHESDALKTPSEVQGTTAPIAVAVDDENYIWIAAGNRLWRGRLNRLGFAQQDK